MVPLNAQAIVDYARENSIKVRRMGVKSEYPKLCARNIILHSITPFNKQNFQTLPIDELEFIASKYDIAPDDINEIENGFEGFASSKDTNSPYYKLGEEIYRLSKTNA